MKRIVSRKGFGALEPVFTSEETEALQDARRWMQRLLTGRVLSLNSVDRINIRMAIPFLNSALDKIEDATAPRVEIPRLSPRIHLDPKELVQEGICKHCGASGTAGEECSYCVPSDDLGPMIYQAVNG